MREPLRERKERVCFCFFAGEKYFVFLFFPKGMLCFFGTKKQLGGLKTSQSLFCRRETGRERSFLWREHKKKEICRETCGEIMGKTGRTDASLFMEKAGKNKKFEKNKDIRRYSERVSRAREKNLPII